MAGLCAVCATAGTAKAQAANRASSGPIQRFMTVPFSLARVWPGSPGGPRQGGISGARQPHASTVVRVGRFGVFERFGRFGRLRRFRVLEVSEVSEVSAVAPPVNMKPILLGEFRHGYATTLLSLVKRPPRLCLYSPRAAWDLLFWRCPIALVLLRGGNPWPSTISSSATPPSPRLRTS